MHVVENRTVITWIHDGQPGGLITGRTIETYGFEVDHIVRFPNTEPGLGDQMCKELLPEVIEHFHLHWIMLKIVESEKAESLCHMAKRFGFILLRREGDVEYWWKGVL